MMRLPEVERGERLAEGAPLRADARPTDARVRRHAARGGGRRPRDAEWIERAAEHVRTLPPKAPKATKKATARFRAGPLEERDAGTDRILGCHRRPRARGRAARPDRCPCQKNRRVPQQPRRRRCRPWPGRSASDGGDAPRRDPRPVARRRRFGPTSSRRCTRPRWPRYGSRSSSMRASSARGSPASAHATTLGRW